MEGPRSAGGKAEGYSGGSGDALEPWGRARRGQDALTFHSRNRQAGLLPT